MMINEFIEMTGFEPTMEEYSEIEEAYYSFDGDKRAFCKHFVDNHSEQTIYQKRVEKINKLRSQVMEVEKALMKTIADRDAEIAMLKAKLEHEQEWKPFEDDHNVKQASYEHLAGCGRKMTDEEAIDWVVEETGFSRERIKILHEVPELEINRHRQVRRTGKMIDRSPVYDATDWNYVRFDVQANVTRSYELYNDELTPFWS